MKVKLMAGIAGLLVSAGLIVGGWLIYQYVNDAASLEYVMSDHYGERMVDFTLEDISGQSTAVSATSGKPKLINFWTSWCPGCQNEAEDLNKIYANYKNNIEIISINVTANDSMEEASAFLDEYNVQMPSLFDQDGIVAAQYGITAIPTNYFIRADGTILKITYEISESSADPLIKELLEEVN
ncbi:hypothetical protein BK133_03765 [Paenibacillus sp. FSL H8-0548]|uniref:TlpA family protein disulfide reductase n=1 Tax=Paenibacillus sp. FSL H8-0548 TaxID=1920422 RepID=UPI00096D047B|nr:TlpA disulfide reductase family protein [Paenibacillus sp. FSL H8-0548]OMF37670.1 hypothetical protein BK133_03765 [Paenibacillus sp. FSL H8-0548]